jgi:2'-5' RNA ligase
MAAAGEGATEAGDGAAGAARPDAIRAFVALDLPEELHARVVDAAHRLKPRVRDIRWVGENTLHLTLRFLGWTKADVVARIEGPLREAAQACPPFETRIAGLGTFPPRGRPRVLWLGMSLPAAALALQQQCERAAVALGFEPEERAFQAHLTLGRWRGGGPRPDLPALDLGTGTVSRLVLYRSRLRPTGSVYTPLAVFPLGG